MSLRIDILRYSLTVSQPRDEISDSLAYVLSSKPAWYSRLQLLHQDEHRFVGNFKEHIVNFELEE